MQFILNPVKRLEDGSQSRHLIIAGCWHLVALQSGVEQTDNTDSRGLCVRLHFRAEGFANCNASSYRNTYHLRIRTTLVLRPAALWLQYQRSRRTLSPRRFLEEGMGLTQTYYSLFFIACDGLMTEFGYFSQSVMLAAPHKSPCTASCDCPMSCPAFIVCTHAGH